MQHFRVFPADGLRRELAHTIGAVELLAPEPVHRAAKRVLETSSAWLTEEIQGNHPDPTGDLDSASALAARADLLALMRADLRI